MRLGKPVLVVLAAISCMGILGGCAGMMRHEMTPAQQPPPKPDKPVQPPAPKPDKPMQPPAAAKEKAEQKSFSKPDEVREFNNGNLKIVNVSGKPIGLLTLQPGWKWSKDMKEKAKTESCHAPHFQYHISGTLQIKMDDGTEITAKAGDVTALPMGHDAWVVGNEPVVVVDWWGATSYAK